MYIGPVGETCRLKALPTEIVIANAEEGVVYPMQSLTAVAMGITPNELVAFSSSCHVLAVVSACAVFMSIRAMKDSYARVPASVIRDRQLIFYCRQYLFICHIMYLYFAVII
jgi:hypothetical protein